MKLIVALAVVCVSTSAYAAKPACYKAENPQTIDVEIANNDDGSEMKHENGAGAVLKVYERENVKLAKISVVTDAGTKIVAEAFRTENDPRPANGISRCGVECDGGSMNLIQGPNGKLIFTSLYLRADIEGCDGTARIKSAGTVFAPTKCK